MKRQTVYHTYGTDDDDDDDEMTDVRVLELLQQSILQPVPLQVNVNVDLQNIGILIITCVL